MATHSIDSRLRRHVEALEGIRHPDTAPRKLAEAEAYVAEQLAATRLEVERRPFSFRGTRYHNVIATRPGTDATGPRVLVGAHFDSARATPGADDNASGIAVLLEVARALAAEAANATTIELVGFNLEEPQEGLRFRVGSRVFAKDARRAGVDYRAALILEMVGYTDTTRGSQTKPFLLFWKRVPRAGTFLAATGDGQSARLLRTFATVSRAEVPELPIVTFRTPFRGFVVPHTRLSDNASFWDEGYPALMLTDTAFLRNPHYHEPSDRSDTLDYTFMASVSRSVHLSVRQLARIT